MSRGDIASFIMTFVGLMVGGYVMATSEYRNQREIRDLRGRIKNTISILKCGDYHDGDEAVVIDMALRTLQDDEDDVDDAVNEGKARS